MGEKISLVGRTITPLIANSYKYYKNDGSITTKENIRNTEVRLNVRFAFREKFISGDFNRISIYEGDITQLLLKYKVDLTKIFKVLKKYLLSTDIKELEETTLDIQRRIKRFYQQNQQINQQDK